MFFMILYFQLQKHGGKLQVNHMITNATCGRHLTVWEVHQLCQNLARWKMLLDTFISKSNNYQLVRYGTCAGISEMLLHQVITIENNCCYGN